MKKKECSLSPDVNQRLHEAADRKASLEARLNDSYTWYLEKIRGIASLDEMDQDLVLDLVAAAQVGILEARNALILHSQKTVAKAAKRNKGRGLEMLEMIDEGSASVIGAIERFDFGRGNEFAAFIYITAFRTIQRQAKSQVRAIRRPDDTEDQLGRLSAIRTELTQVLSREPTEGETIEKSLEMGLRNAEDLMKAFKERTDSIDALISDDSEATLADTLKDDRAYPPSSPSLLKDELEKINRDVTRIVELVNGMDLSDQNKYIFFRRYGIIGGSPLSAEELHERYHVSVTNINRVLRDVWLKLKKKTEIAFTHARLERTMAILPTIEESVGVNGRN